MKTRVLTVAVCCLLAFSCGQRDAGKGQPEYRQFPRVEIPSLISGTEELTKYTLDHFWDGFFAGTGVTDSSAVLGVRNKDLEVMSGAFFQLVSNVSKAEGQKYVAKLFSQIEDKHRADSTSHVYLLMTDLVSNFLYDPNSPYRDEDLYLPFLKGMIASPFTREEVLPGYLFEERMCSLNQYGTKAANFSFKDIKDRTHDLYGIKAEYTILFFSNPGCESCREIVLTLRGNEKLSYLISKKEFAVVNIYIDEELDKWREYEKNYPATWYSGYDFRHIIRQDAIYNARAIPSLYLLDKDKNVLMKDVPTEKLMQFIDNINPT